MAEDSRPKRTFYGRRQGRKLRAGRARLIETVLPRLSVTLPADGKAIDWRALFQAPIDRLWLEIGFGAGEHLLALARHNPKTGFVGCEPYVNGISSLLAAVEAEELENVRVFPDDANALLRALHAGSVDRCFLLFPDPWPKTRHHRRRFIQPQSVAELARILSPGAELRIASDDAPLVEWMLFHIRRNGHFDWLAESASDWRVRPDDWPPTRYEAKRLHGPPVFMRFRRIANGTGKP
ncbi:MAG: tRNA (guanosine(46)-N7)-methyltransferase TrmB [Pseudomonadota bacterium]